MIDIEPEVFDAVEKRVTAKFPEVDMASEYVPVPSGFPHVSLYEADNHVLTETQDTSHTERHAVLMYQADVYSNRIAGKKSQCRKIMVELDAAMADMGFTRTTLTPVPNMNDATIYRLTARYTVLADEKYNYRRI